LRSSLQANVHTGIGLLAFVAMVNLGLGCEERRAAPVPLTTSPVQSAAKTLYSDRCAGCHGPQGHADGPLAKGLAKLPRDFSDPTWRSKTSDDAMRKVILKGGAAVGASELMPGNPDLASKPELVNELIVLIRGF
jgi:mono/diheme cytochrome c family protein